MNKENLVKVVINEDYYYKTSFSAKGKNCVGVKVENDKIFVINTKEKKTVVTFTKEEWSAFILGVKSGHFDNL